MYVGSLIMGLIGIGATVGGAAAGAHYANAAHKTEGAALGAGAGIALFIVAGAFFAASEADTAKQTNAQLTAARNAKLAGNVGRPDPHMQRLTAVPMMGPTR